MELESEGDRTVASPSFTLVELLVVVATIALLLSILLPALGAARGAARQVRCGANLREIGHALRIYAETHRGALPTAEASHSGDTGPANWWENSDLLEIMNLEPLPQRRSVLTCPEDAHPERYANYTPKPCWVSFGANTSCLGMRCGGSKKGRLLSQVAQPAEALGFCDGRFGEREALVVGWQGCVLHAIDYRHRGRAMAVFLDAHVAPIQPADLPPDDGVAWQDPLWGNVPQFW